MKNAIAVFVSVFLLVGCKYSAQQYVDLNAKGKFIVKGQVVQITALHSTKWEDLKDGFAIIVAHPGCEVTLKQADETSSRKTTFPLVENDIIVHSYDGDFILSALAHNRPDQVGEVPAKDGKTPKDPKPADPKPEDPKPADPKPEDKKPEDKPEEKKPEDKKPEDKKG